MKQIQIERERILSVLKKVKIFSYLSEHDLDEILKICKIFEFDEKEKIISEGDINPYLYAVIKGTVSVIVREMNGKEVYISSIGKSDIFGEAGLFVNVKRTANVVAMTIVEAIQIERKGFITFIKQNQNGGLTILMLIIYSLLQKLREANQELAFERKSFYNQEEVDNLIQGLLTE